MSIRTRLLLLVFAVWVPAMAGFGLLARATSLREEAAVQARMRDTLKSACVAIDRELGQRAALASTLAATRELREGDLARFDADARAAAAGGDAVVLVDADHRQWVDTRYPWGAVPAEPPWQDGPALLAPGQPPVVSDLLHRSGDGRWSLAVLAPVAGRRGGRYNVGVLLDPRVLQKVLAQLPLPRGAVLAVFDRDDRIIARTQEPQRWLGARVSPESAAELRAASGEVFEHVSREGHRMVATVLSSRRWGLRFAIGVPRRTLDQMAARMTAQAFGAAVALAVIGLAAALVFIRSIREPMRALSRAADELGRDGVPAPLATGLQEVDKVGAALHRAGLRSAQGTALLERRVAEAVHQTEEAQRRLFEAQKHEAIGRLSAGVAHDLNNFLQTMSTGLQVLGRHPTPEVAERVTEACRRAVDKAAALVRQMLAFGRAQPLRPQSVELRDFVLHAQDLMARAIGWRVRLGVEIDADLPPVHADPTQLELALLNLVFNARDAMPGGGNVVIRARRATAPETEGLAPGDYLSLEVSDNGPGMTPEVARHAFEPYFTTKPVGVGSGLGLPQVRAFAEQSGGTATLASQPGEGAIVRLVLPAGHRAALPAPAETVSTAPVQPLRLLFVEDDLLVSSVVVPALREAGLTVRHCLDGESALRVLGTDASFDAVFTDVVMPGTVGGLEVLRWCEQHAPDVAVVVGSGYASPPRETGLQVLKKPYRLETLLDALQQAVDGKQA